MLASSAGLLQLFRSWEGFCWYWPFAAADMCVVLGEISVCGGACADRVVCGAAHDAREVWDVMH